VVPKQEHKFSCRGATALLPKIISRESNFYSWMNSFDCVDRSFVTEAIAQEVVYGWVHRSNGSYIGHRFSNRSRL
jgi:hypothetical protein